MGRDGVGCTANFEATVIAGCTLGTFNLGFMYGFGDGSFAAINVICQVTELLTKEEFGKRIGQIPKHKGGVLGVKFEMKLFVSQ